MYKDFLPRLLEMSDEAMTQRRTNDAFAGMVFLILVLVIGLAYVY